MAPLYMDLQMLDAANPPVLVFLSVVIFILAITLLALCTSCQRQSFTLESSAPAGRTSSSTVQVVNPGNGVDNSAPGRTDLTIRPEDLELGPNQQFKAWRSHTIERIPQPTMNGVSSTVTL